MAKEIQRFTDEAISQYNLLSDEEVATLKIKVGKSHRSEKDWDVIKKLITDKAVITMNSMDRKLYRKTSIENVFTDKGFLIVFSNINDCANYIRWFNQQMMRNGYFEIGAIPFGDVLDISDRKNIPVAIDMDPATRGHFIYYEKGRMADAILAR